MQLARLRAPLGAACLALGFAATDASAQLSRLGPADVSFVCAGPLGMNVTGTSEELTATTDGLAVTVAVPLASLSTGMDLRDRLMKRDYLEVQRYPRAELRVPRASLRLPAPGRETTGVARGQLFLHGRSRIVTFRYGARRTGHAYDVTGSVRIDVRDFGIDEPSWVGVPLRHDVDVRVRFRVVDV